MATLMDQIMGEYRTMSAGSPDYTLGSRRTMMQPGGQFNDAGNLGNMGMRQSMRAQEATGAAPVNPAFMQAPGPFAAPRAQYPFLRPFDPGSAMPRPGQFDETNIAAPQFTPERRSPFDETNIAAPRFAPASVAQGSTNIPLPPRIPGGETRSAREPGFFERIFGGTQYQSNNMPVNMMPQGPMAGTGAPMPQYINYGDPNSAADFFRADQAMMQQNPSFFGLLGGSNG